jgi:sulfite exporter TauE/SafE
MEGFALIAAAGLMGLAGLPHCAAMCAAPCAAVTARGGASQALFQGARVAGYASAGAVAAWSVGALRDGLSFSPALRPLWTLLHLTALAFGLWILWHGRWPALLQRAAGPAADAALPGGWQRMRQHIKGPVRSACAGALWIAWPCALSQSALLVAALASTPEQGAVAMGAFALASAPALWLGPLLMQRLSGGRGGEALVTAAWPMRAAGALLALGSIFALGHGLWMRVAAWCGLA